VEFLCVPTPMGEGGAADLAAVEALRMRCGVVARGCVVVNKSTVPVGRRRDEGVVGASGCGGGVESEFCVRVRRCMIFESGSIVGGVCQQDAAERVGRCIRVLGRRRC